jgi:hypothetical protein
MNGLSKTPSGSIAARSRARRSNCAASARAYASASRGTMEEACSGMLSILGGGEKPTQSVHGFLREDLARDLTRESIGAARGLRNRSDQTSRRLQDRAFEEGAPGARREYRQPGMEARQLRDQDRQRHGTETGLCTDHGGEGGSSGGGAVIPDAQDQPDRRRRGLLHVEGQLLHRYRGA